MALLETLISFRVPAKRTLGTLRLEHDGCWYALVHVDGMPQCDGWARGPSPQVAVDEAVMDTFDKVADWHSREAERQAQLEAFVTAEAKRTVRGKPSASTSAQQEELEKLLGL